MKRLALALLLTGCPKAEAPAPDAGCGCEKFGAPQQVGGVPAVLDEISGLVASRSQPGVLYAHNDSGDSARFFALSDQGELLATFTLAGASARDWEDLAIGACGAATCVYLGDIGDNSRVRDDYAIYRVVEPKVSDGSRDVPWERIPYVFPDNEKFNAEALFMHNGVLYLGTKHHSGPSFVFRFPSLTPGETVTLELVATLPVPAQGDQPLTGADVSPCGNALLLRMYNRAVELRLPGGAANFEAIFEAEPQPIAVTQEEQGEAIAYSPDGRSFFTASEHVVSPQALMRSDCRP